MKNQKNSGLFCFFAWIVVTCLLKICPKPKKTWVFLVFFLTSSKSSFKKPKKPWVFFSFFKVMTKKTKKTRGKPKKPNMSLRPNILWKVLVFWFFGFIEVFCFLVFPMASLLKRSQIADSSLQTSRKPKNQNFSENVWSEAHVCFFWFSSSFFVFFWSWPWKN